MSDKPAEQPSSDSYNDTTSESLKANGEVSANLPPVEAPNAGFLLQLFLIPLVIVTIIVVVCLMMSWIAHMGSDPKDLARDLKKLNEGSWQKAFTLSTMLRDRKYDHLKEDEEFAALLTEVLENELTINSRERPRVMMQIYLCRALGEFRVASVLPVLVRAGGPKQYEEQRDVRLAAIQALAIAADGLLMHKAIEPVDLHAPDSDIMKLLLNLASFEESDGVLRHQATYALGVVGGDDANKRLRVLISHADANTRYNAAIGLARQGDEICKSTLMEMLDPANRRALEGEEEKMHQRKQVMVLMNGIRAAVILGQSAKRLEQDVDLSPVVTQLSKLEQSKITDVRYAATEARVELEKLAAN